MANLIFHRLLLLCSLQLLSASVSSGYPDSPLAKPHCSEKCGNISIPFPFGIGYDCFLDEWYEILCNQNDSVPRLKKLGLQVLNISLPIGPFGGLFNSIISVSYPISYSNSSSCEPENYGNRTVPSLSGSPFFFSQLQNSFVAVGCDHVATARDSGYGHSFIGCQTTCSGNKTRRLSACDGFDCCQSAIPYGIQELTINIQENGNSGTDGISNECRTAFLVNSSWFRPNKTDLYVIRDRGYVPVVLEWGLLNDSLPRSIGIKNYGYYYYYYNYYYEVISFCLTGRAYINGNTTPIIQCNCGHGFYGNPYIDDGCQDINECEIDGQRRCGNGATCKNVPGSFHCVHGKTLFIIIGLCSSLGSLSLIFLAWRAFKLIKKRRAAKLKQKFFKRNGGLILRQHLSSPGGSVDKSRLFNSKELEKATDRFNKDRILGKGGQGTVYKGMLTDGRIVAIKKSLQIDEESVEPFINEVFILSQINQRNIVRLLGCCLETKVPLLVYEFIPNGTLYEYLHHEESLVSWDARLRIANEVAGALFYLHSSASIPIYHRDIKSSNILLDEKYRAKVADFGTSRSVSLDQTHVTTLVQGTFGYLDPEYFQSSQFTDKSDVYSFGVVLVELLTREKPVSSLRANEGRSLATYFIISMEEGRLFDILDTHIVEQVVVEEIVAVANLAKRCLNLKGRKRPTMKEVVIELERIRPSQPASTSEPSHERNYFKETTTSEGYNAWNGLSGFENNADETEISDVCSLILSGSGTYMGE